MSQTPVRVVEIPGIEFSGRKTYLEIKPGDDMIGVSQQLAKQAAGTMKGLIDGRVPAAVRASMKPGAMEPKTVIAHGDN